MSLTRSVFAFAVSALAAVSVHASVDVQWELKGLAVGMPIEEVKAAVPELACETLGEGLEQCTHSKASFANEPAELSVYFMDGKALAISFNKLPSAFAEQCAVLLTEKYGPPSFSVVENNYDYAVRDYVRRQRHTWDRDGVQLQAHPFAWRDNRAKKTYARVRLLDATTWDQEWLPRMSAADRAAKNPSTRQRRSDI